MSTDDSNTGFSGAFTWSNIGMQVANGLISGSAGFVITGLLDHLTSNGQTMQEMMERFADELVGRLTTEFKQIIDQAFFKDNLQRLKTSAASLGQKYATFQATGDPPLLDAAVDHSFNAVEEAITMGPAALGDFVVVAGLKLCLLEEKAKLNAAFHDVALSEVQRFSSILEETIDELFLANQRAVGQFHSCRTPPGEILSCLIKVDGVTRQEDIVTTKAAAREGIINRLNNVTSSQIVDPARQIASTWKNLK